VNSYHFLPRLFHGYEGGTMEAYGPDLDKESLSGSPFSVILRRRLLCIRRDGRAGDDGGAHPRWAPLGAEGTWVVARILTRVGACTDKLRYMGVERAEFLVDVGGAGGGWDSIARNVFNAWGPPLMERMWVGPCGDGANCTMQFVVRGGRLCLRRCSRVRRFAVTTDCRSREGIAYSRLVIELISNPNQYYSSASPRVHFCGSDRTRNSSTHVKHLLRRIRIGSRRAKAW
jgi:hypothetical protein